LKQRLLNTLATARQQTPLGNALGLLRRPRSLGFDDGVIIPPESFAVGTSYATIRRAAAIRTPLRGAVRVAVAVVDFSDAPLSTPLSHYEDLFFSQGVLPHGSVQEYYREVTHGLIELTGEVVGTLRMPQTLAYYANHNYGVGQGSGAARAQLLARDAAVAAASRMDFAPYDNDGNGFVDAFIVLHAGPGGEVTGDTNDIWSHKWTLPSAYSVNGKQIYGYLTIPEDAKIGVCAHELGHLLFGFPDLYDTDYTSEGIGNWCLMAGGSWNGDGDIPAHPSAWCKVSQDWVELHNVTEASLLTLPDVKSSRIVHRVWKDGTQGSEYYLLENRQRSGYDAELPGEGLLIWHIDDAQPSNTDESHFLVGLVQADGRRDLEVARNGGDAGDVYPGSSRNRTFDSTSTPSSRSYANQDTCVAIRDISATGASMSASVNVACSGDRADAESP
jgi:immune inhibitor A